MCRSPIVSGLQCGLPCAEWVCRDVGQVTWPAESLELVQHLEKPGYELEVIEQDENSNSQRAQLINNNVEIHPVRI